MANFNTHFNVAFMASAALGVVVFKAGMLSPSLLIGCVAAGTIGGLLPDLDSDNSRPLDIGFNILAALAAFMMVVWFADQLVLWELVAAGVLGFATIRYGVFTCFTWLTVHRGVMHSVPYVLMFGLISLYLAFYGLGLTAVDSWFVAAFISFGALIHLILDETYSVNLLNMTVKQSFGTALKLYKSTDWYWYLALYLGLLVGWYCAPDGTGFYYAITDLDAWRVLGQNLIR